MVITDWLCDCFARLYDVFRGYRNVTVGKNGLSGLITYEINVFFFVKVVIFQYLIYVEVWWTKSLLYKWSFFVLFISITFYLIKNVKWIDIYVMMSCDLSHLTPLWRRSLSYRNQFIDLLCKSMDWFLDDRDLHHERVNQVLNR